MDLIKTFAQDFTKSTGIKVDTYCDERTFPHWKRLALPHSLNCDDLEKISNFIRERFSENGKYSELLVKLTVFSGGITLTADVKELDRVYNVVKDFRP